MTDPPMSDFRKMGIGPHDHYLLHLFGKIAEEAWGETPYLVGSSQRGEPWRDIDVRVMLSNEAYAAWFGPVWQTGKRHVDPRWRGHMLAWSKLGERLTGLPIDFQVERLSEANALWPNERRNAIGLWPWTTSHDAGGTAATGGNEEDKPCPNCGMMYCEEQP